MKRKYWTKEEEQFLIDNLGTKSYDELSVIFNVDKLKIIDKVHKIGLNGKAAKGIYWSEEEDNVLKEHFAYAPKDYIMNLLPKRTWATIFVRGNKHLGLTRLSQDKISVNYNFFSEWNEKVAYIFGFILADGHIINKNGVHALQIEQSLKDKDILFKIKEALDFKGEVHVNKTAKLQINNVKIINDLIEKGMPVEDKSHNAIFPEDLPKEFYRDFIRGVIDGDGWSTINKDGYSLGLCGNYDLISKVKDNLIEDCSNNSIRKDATYCWRFNIKGKKAKRIASWLYKDAQIFLERKYNNFLLA